MKTLKMLAIVIALAGLAGCANETFHQIGDKIIVGDQTFTALLAKDVDPWGVNVSTIMITASGHKPLPPHPPQANMTATHLAAPQPQPAVVARQPQAQPPDPQPVAAVQVTMELVNTHVVNCNNAQSIGWANGAFRGAVGDAILGGSMMGSAALLRPSRISMKGGGASSSSSSASSAAASASSGP